MIIVGLALAGLCLGSFVNALTWRINEQSKSKAKAKDPKFSMLRGRSMCPNCKHELGVWDLVPIFSWVALRGKCRYCSKPISSQYPLVELATAMLFVISYISWPYSLLTTNHYSLTTFIIWLAILTGLVALVIYDLKWMILPDKIIFPLVGLASVSALTRALDAPDLRKFLINVTLSLVVSFGFFYVLFQVSSGKWIGGGDVKYGLIYGLLLADPLKSTLVIFTASILGTIFAIPMLVNKKLNMKAKIPFGPFLILATIIVYLWGSQVVNWYLNQFIVI